MSWTCPLCGRTEALAPKHCGCAPYDGPVDEVSVSFYLWAMGAPSIELTEATYEMFVAELRDRGALAADGKRGDDHTGDSRRLCRQQAHFGIETGGVQEHEIPLTEAEYADFSARARTRSE